MKARGFLPTEIIFASTTACNLHCAHCFVNRAPVSLNMQDAIKFLHSCRDTSIQKIGFSGGEPFLHLEFICGLSKSAVEDEFLFDQIITNGDWWKTPEDLTNAMNKLYDSGYDGKISISFDTFHNQTAERTALFINTVSRIFGNQSLTIQSVINDDVKDDFFARLTELSALLKTDLTDYTDKKTKLGIIYLESSELYIPVYIQPQTLESTNPLAWNAKKWFKEDYCQGPGNVLFVHADGNIAPCCGFANENPALFIGNIKQDFSAVIKNSEQNQMVNICYKEGLSHFRSHGLKQIFKQNSKKLPGKKCAEICTFCDFVCKSLNK